MCASPHACTRRPECGVRGEIGGHDPGRTAEEAERRYRPCARSAGPAARAADRLRWRASAAIGSGRSSAAAMHSVACAAPQCAGRARRRCVRRRSEDSVFRPRSWRDTRPRPSLEIVAAPARIRPGRWKPRRGLRADSGVVMLCVDGSDLAARGGGRGLRARARPSGRPLVVTVIEASDESLVTRRRTLRWGHVGRGALRTRRPRSRPRAARLSDAAAAALGIDAARDPCRARRPGPALCALAARAFRACDRAWARAAGAGSSALLLGSVSDYLVRNAPCPVVITGATS